MLSRDQTKTASRIDLRASEGHLGPGTKNFGRWLTGARKMGKLFDFFKGHYASQFSSKDDEKPLAQLLEEAEAYYAPMLPKKADADTRLDSVEVTNTTFTMHSTLITMAREDLEGLDFGAEMRPILQQEARRVKRLGRILAKGGTLIYTYADMNGESVAEVRLSAD